MSHALLTPDRAHKARPEIPLFRDVTLSMGRVHEFCGPARRTLAAIVASRLDGPVFWIRPSWHPDALYLPALARFFNPGRLTLLSPNRVDEFLWTMETALREGCVPLVVGDFHAPVELTPVRRLHLAAESAMEDRMRNVIGILLSPGNGGSPGVETRWHLAGRHNGPARRWHLERRRARMEPPRAWELRPGWTLEPRPLESRPGEGF